MTKKKKLAQSRRDKFYFLAKDAGYRARSAFKLLQLNRKFGFLQKSQVCIDLCAAPGGWLQVASQMMPISSVILGVDLVPIKPVNRCLTIQEDITTEKCRQKLRNELKDNKVDVVLNDGAPNVGTSWLQDAFQQAQLTLYAAKLASDFLRQGGWFVTKLFRSKDYNAMIWLFNQLFRKVHVTKPDASRNESAEIFVVCESYLQPEKVDPKFFDPKHIFKDTDKDTTHTLFNQKQKKAAEGYAEGDYTLHHPLNVSEFLAAENFQELLVNASELVVDDPKVLEHKATTKELLECMKDIKVLGKKELRSIVNWRKHMRAHASKAASNSANMEPMQDSEKTPENTVEEEIQRVAEEERLESKRKRRKMFEEKRKLRNRIAMGMLVPGDQLAPTEDEELFVPTKTDTIKQELALEQKVFADELPEEEQPAESKEMLSLKNDYLGLALAEEMIKSRKRKRELEESGIHRFSKYGKEDLPEWFTEDEKRHFRKKTRDIVSPAVREDYERKMKAINAKPIKKVVEAKARKKRKQMKRMERARKKAEVVTDNADMNNHEKWKQIKDIYKKAGLMKSKKRHLTYIVAKKGTGKKVSRPKGVKGQFKVVDPRMKKDNRKAKGQTKK